MASIEEKVEEQYKGMLDALGVRHYGKTEKINSAISNALKMQTANPVDLEIIFLTFS